MEAIGIPDQKYNTSEKTNNNGQFLVRASHKKYALFFFLKQFWFTIIMQIKNVFGKMLTVGRVTDSWCVCVATRVS